MATPTNSNRPAFLDKAIAAVDHGAAVAESMERGDLASRLKGTRARLDEPEVTVVVAGEFKQGKSTLVNSLLNTDLCPVHDDVSTVVPTVVRHGESTEAAVISPPESEEIDEEPEVEAFMQPTRHSITIESIGDYAAETGNPGNVLGIAAVELALSRRLLESGLVLVDTPGVGGLRSVHGAATEAMLATADVVIFVTDASQELTLTEIDFLKRAHDACPNVVCVVTKVDLYLDWRRIVELDRGHISDAGLDLEVVPVSSPLRHIATTTSDRDMNVESGYAELVRWLRDVVLAQRQRLMVRAAGADLIDVARQLAGPVASEKAILDDPEHAAEVIADLTERKAKAEQLLAQTARWQSTLNDGSQDLASEVDHDLRRRMRGITNEAAAKIDEADPTQMWEEFSTWLEQEVAAAITANSHVLVEQSAALAKRVAELFAADGEGLVDTSSVIRSADGTSDSDLVFDLTEEEAFAGALTAVRGGFGGALMINFVASVAGLATLAALPIAAVVGIGLGRRALKEQKQRNLLVAQQKAKASVSKYIDQVSFQANKESRDMVRRVQRELRDTYRERAKEVETSTRDALNAATTASKKTEAEARTRRAELDAKLENVARLERNAAALMSIQVEGMS